MLGSIAKLIQLTIQWAGNNVFTDTRGLVLTTSFLVLGLQMISAVLFISIFSGRLSRTRRGAPSAATDSAGLGRSRQLQRRRRARALPGRAGRRHR